MTYQLARLLFDYVVRPSHERLLDLRQRFVTSGVASFNDEIFLELQEAIDSGDLDGALTFLYSRMPQILLSPRAHWWAASLEDRLNGPDQAQVEQTIGDRLVEAIMSTGDGSRSRPFHVLRVDDEYDVLGALGKTFRQQSFIAELSCDVLACADGSELWFDVSDVVGR